MGLLRHILEWDPFLCKIKIDSCLLYKNIEIIYLLIKNEGWVKKIKIGVQSGPTERCLCWRKNYYSLFHVEKLTRQRLVYIWSY